MAQALMENRLLNLHCLRCDHDWTSVKEPVRCPSCRSKRWRFRPVVLVCQRCQFGSDPKDPWQQKLDKLPKICPRCKSKYWQRPRMSMRARKALVRERLKVYWEGRRSGDVVDS